MNFVNRKAVSEIRYSKDDVGKDVGIYCWWFRDDCLNKLLNKISGFVDLKRLNAEKNQHKVLNGAKYTALYVGIAAGKNGIFGRFKWHIEQKHSVSNVTKGYLSTLRRTLSALQGYKLLKNNTEVNFHLQEELNAFMDANCALEWNYYPKKTKKELEQIEDEIINSGYFPLNIQGNRQISNELRKKLGEMRKSACSFSSQI